MKCRGDSGWPLFFTVSDRRIYFGDSVIEASVAFSQKIQSIALALNDHFRQCIMVAGTAHDPLVLWESAQLSTQWLGKPLNSIFDVIDLLTSSLLLPLGGLLLAVLAGWVMTRDNAKDGLMLATTFLIFGICASNTLHRSLCIIFLQLIGII